MRYHLLTLFFEYPISERSDNTVEVARCCQRVEQLIVEQLMRMISFADVFADVANLI